MLPALLTCFFVIYLHQHLKAEQADAGDGEVDTTGLVQRIDSLRSRLDALANKKGGGPA